jgi:hypothetical protein
MEDELKNKLIGSGREEGGEGSKESQSAAGQSSAPATTSDPEVDPELDMNSIFSTRKPKDAVAGVASGLKSIGKGGEFLM